MKERHVAILIARNSACAPKGVPCQENYISYRSRYCSTTSKWFISVVSISVCPEWLIPLGLSKIDSGAVNVISKPKHTPNTACTHQPASFIFASFSLTSAPHPRSSRCCLSLCGYNDRWLWDGLDALVLSRPLPSSAPSAFIPLSASQAPLIGYSLKPVSLKDS
jgi:hypothetical protein